MEDVRPVTPLAPASLGFSAVGWAVGLLSLLVDYQRMAGATAGVGAGNIACLVALVASTSWLTGIGCGIAALRRIRLGEFRGRGLARAGIILGCLPFVLFAAWAIPLLWQEVSVRIWGLPAR
jgi:hypothetical protein